MKRVKPAYQVKMLSFFIVSFFPMFAFADMAQKTSDDFFHIFDGIDNTFYNTAIGWVTSADDIAQKTFFLLAAIDILVIGIKCVLYHEEIKDVFNSFIVKIILLCGCLALIQNAPRYFTDVFLRSFEQVGSKVTGIQVLSPTGLIDDGFSLISQLISKVSGTSLLHPFNILVIVFAIIALLYSFLVIAWELLTTKIEAYILMFGGVFFLAFSGSQFTRRYAYSYLQYCFATGVKLFVAYLIVACGVKITQQVAVVINSHPDFTTNLNNLMIICASYLTFATIAKKIAPMANGFISGVTSTSASHHMATVGAAVGTAGAVVGTVASTVAGPIGGTTYQVAKVAGAAAARKASQMKNNIVTKNFNQNPPPPPSPK